MDGVVLDGLIQGVEEGMGEQNLGKICSGSRLEWLEFFRLEGLEYLRLEGLEYLRYLKLEWLEYLGT